VADNEGLLVTTVIQGNETLSAIIFIINIQK